MKKEIDLAQVLRDSILKANKDLGFLKEQQEFKSAFDEEFDPKKHMPSLELAPKKWGTVGTVEAKQLDAIVANLVPQGEKDGLVRFKTTLTNLNKALGVTFAKGGESEYTTFEDKGQQSNINEIVSGLMIKNLMHNLITNMPAGGAGTAYEGFIARLAGGYSSNETDKPIEDLVDAAGNFVSLKLIIGNTEIKGSLSGLAKGIVESPNNKVIYLVCVKDRENDPFKLSSYSFEINEKNFFSFIVGKNNPTAAEVTQFKEKIYKDLGIATTVTPTNTGEVLSEVSFAHASEKISVEQYEEIAKRYFEQQGLGEYSRQNFIKHINDVVNSVGDLTEEELNVLNVLLKREKFEPFKKENFKSDIKTRMVKSGTGGALFNKSSFSRLMTILPKAIKEIPKEKETEIRSAALKAADPEGKYSVDIDASERASTKKEEFITQYKIQIYKRYSGSSEQTLKALEAASKQKSIEEFKTTKEQSIKKEFAESKQGKSLQAQPEKYKEAENKFVEKAQEKFVNEKISQLDNQAELSGKAQYKKEVEGQFQTSGSSAKSSAAMDNLKQKYTAIRAKLAPLINFFANFEYEIDKVAPEEEKLSTKEKEASERIVQDYPGETPEEKAKAEQDSQSAQKLFFTYLKKYFAGEDAGQLREAGEGGGISTQFLIPQNSVKKLVSIDSSYPQIVIEKTQLFDSANKNAKLFKDWVEPIYRGMHYLTQGVNQYFIEDMPNGLANAETKGIEVVKSGITKFKTQQAGGEGSGEVPKASQVGKQKEPQQVAESKKTAFNDDFLDDILKDLI
jgi:hypothetical protein